MGQILKGAERQDWIRRLAFQRAYWEREFETSDFYAEARERGATVQEFRREQVVRAIARHFEDGQVPFLVSDAFVRSVQARVKSARHDIDEFDPLAATTTKERTA